jgi:hypothetical protein
MILADHNQDNQGRDNHNSKKQPYLRITTGPVNRAPYMFKITAKIMPLLQEKKYAIISMRYRHTIQKEVQQNSFNRNRT